MAEALVAAALPSPAAEGFALGLPAHGVVHVCTGTLLALAPGPQVPGIAGAQPAGIGPVATALAAGRRGVASAAAEAVVGHGHLQRVPEAGGLDGEGVGGVLGGAASRLHGHLEGHLQGQVEMGIRIIES